MKKQVVLGLLMLLCAWQAQAASPKVPEVILFADMRLELTADARKKVQTDVDALTRYEKYFNAKVDRIDAYFPLIEPILREENVPEDIKYLVIQESALVGDAVSSANAIGYWQFKVPAAEEVGLTINSAVDERMNIITATRGAARYFKNNNALFDNWLHALMAYYEGPGGALKKADKRFNGRKVMRLDGKTHWYILKYLSHKIAFEEAVGKNLNPPVQLFVYRNGGGKSLREIAEEFQVTEEDLRPYNTWLKQRKVPQDKGYPIIVPDFSGRSIEPPLASNEKPDRKLLASPPENNTVSVLHGEKINSQVFPLMKTRQFLGREQLLVNGIPAVIVKEGEDVKRLSQRTGVAPSRIIKFNNLGHPQAAITVGQPYYLRAKRNRAPARYHIAEPGETWWDVSQRFGIKLRKLLRNNRLRDEKPLQAYQVLWLRYIRPDNFPVEFQPPPEMPDQQLPTTVVASKSLTVSPKITENENVKEPSANGNTAPSLDPTDPEASERAWRNDPEEATEDTSKKEIDKVEYHTVQAQETLYSIARQYQVSVADLAGHNQLSIYDTIKPGQQLRLPITATPIVAANEYHEVQPGETMYQIARQHQISIRELMEWNQKENFNLKVGEQLRVTAP
ncbi:MAG: LysM peptidoglycan-binding domain-containing protein [Bacteroidota bacterium]